LFVVRHLCDCLRFESVSVLDICLRCNCTECCVYVDEPSTSGLQANDYPVLSDDSVGLAALKEIGTVKRLPLPAELAERFACILRTSSMCCSL